MFDAAGGIFIDVGAGSDYIIVFTWVFYVVLYFLYLFVEKIRPYSVIQEPTIVP